MGERAEQMALPFYQSTLPASGRRLREHRPDPPLLTTLPPLAHVSNGPVQLQGPLEPAIIHVRISDFAALVALHAQPALAGQQLIVCDSTSARGVVLAALPAARACGVEPGMALRLAEKRCSRPVLSELDSECLLAVAQTLQELLGRYTPLVEPEWVHVAGDQLRTDTARLARCFGAWLDVRGCERLFGPAGTIGYLLSKDLAAHGYMGLVGIATSPSLAAVASAMSSLGEPLLVPAGHERLFLERLPLRTAAAAPLLLDLDPALLAHLEMLGIQRIGEVARLPVASLRRRFGAAGASAHAQACGEAFRQLTIPILPETLQATRDLGDPCTDRPALQQNLCLLAGDLAARLAKGARAAERIALTITDAEGTHTRTMQLKRPVATASAIQQRAAALLTQLTPPAGSCGPIHTIHIELSGFGPAATQLALPIFGAGPHAAAVDEVAARLQRRFGSRAARRAHLVPDALLPEEQVLWDMLDACIPSRHSRPLELQTTTTGQPAALRRGSTAWEQLCSIHSEWRIRTRWWADTVHRHYYVVETRAGVVLEIYRDLPDGSWYLSGRRD